MTDTVNIDMYNKLIIENEYIINIEFIEYNNNIDQMDNIYVYDFILNEAGIAESESKLNLMRGSLVAYSISELEELLSDVLDKEDYESAARIRDIIDRRKI